MSLDIFAYLRVELSHLHEAILRVGIVVELIVGKKDILHINKQLESKFVRERPNIEKMNKTSQISRTHALIQVSDVMNLLV